MANGVAGRPVSQSRNAAIVLGDKTYEGKRCKKCNSTVRYTKGGACVACQRNYSVDSRAALKRHRLLADSDRLLGEEREAAVNDIEQMVEPDEPDAQGPLDADTEPRYLEPDEIPQPWD